MTVYVFIHLNLKLQYLNLRDGGFTGVCSFFQSAMILALLYMYLCLSKVFMKTFMNSLQVR